MRRIILLLALALGACEVAPPPPIAVPQAAPVQVNTRAAPKDFATITRRVGAQARQECQRRTQNTRCDFKISIDPNKRAPANAYQTVDKEGRPLIVFTQALLQQAKNGDEIAFVMGHEAAHHIRGHLGRQRQNATAGAIIFGQLAGLTGGGSAAVDAAQQLGATVGARSYSKDFELEADQLGTVITYKAGYNPLIGVKFFDRIPDPGDRFLGTHPPNAQRISVVRQTSAQLGLVQ